MTKEKEQDPGARVKLITGILDAKKAGDIKILDVRKMSALWDYFVVCSGLSELHVKTLNDYMQVEMKKLGHQIAHSDNGRDSKWMITDFGDILVHIFDAESRQHYAIEKMWGEREELAAKFLKRVAKAVKAGKAKVKNAKKRKK